MTSSSFPSLNDFLNEILAELPLQLPADASSKILTYLDLLDRWNQAYNLTAINDPYDRMVKHIADSLAVAPYLTGERLLDVGSGAGLPGIPLALAFPERHWMLLDKNGKKTRFLVQVKAVLGLKNVEVIQSSVEAFHPKQGFDGVISRAWTKLDDMVVKTRHLYNPKGRLWAMKGTYPRDELATLTQPYTVFEIKVPKLQEQRHLICIEMEMP